MKNSSQRFLNLAQSIWRGDDSRRPRISGVQRLAADESGLVTWATLLAVVCFVMIIAVVFNVGRIANDKLEAQNSADATAYSSSLVQARAMNAITTSNHMIGELTALYVMHHAFGGKLLDDGKTKKNWTLRALDFSIKWGRRGAWWYSLGTKVVGGSTPVGIGPTAGPVKGDDTIYESKLVLKWLMVSAIASHANGSSKIYKGMATTWVGGAGAALIAAGKAQQVAANAMMTKIKQEYHFINVLEKFAIAIVKSGIKKKVLPAMLRALNAYTTLVKEGTPVATKLAAQRIAKKNGGVGEVVGRPGFVNTGKGKAFGVSTELPIVREKTRSEKKSQLIRATFPWVREWRSKLLIAFYAVAPLSRCAQFYQRHTDRYSYRISAKFRRDMKLKLFVLQEMDPLKKDKGRESWTKAEHSSKADRMFCVVGLARHKQRVATAHLAYLPQTNPKPIAAIAQAMLYNANPQKKPKKKKSSPWDWMFGSGHKPQPRVGWDTLNWTKGATEWKKGKGFWGAFFQLTIDANPPEPRVKLNWQAKLVPIADKNLTWRIPLIQDSIIASRMQSQVLPGLVAQRLRFEVIHH